MLILLISTQFDPYGVCVRANASTENTQTTYGAVTPAPALLPLRSSQCFICRLEVKAAIIHPNLSGHSHLYFTDKNNVTKEEVLRSWLVSAVFKSDASCLQVSSSAKNSGQMSLGHTELLPLTYSVLCCSLQHILSLNTPLCSPSPPVCDNQYACMCVYV